MQVMSMRQRSCCMADSMAPAWLCGGTLTAVRLIGIRAHAHPVRGPDPRKRAPPPPFARLQGAHQDVAEFRAAAQCTLKPEKHRTWGTPLRSKGGARKAVRERVFVDSVASRQNSPLCNRFVTHLLRATSCPRESYMEQYTISVRLLFLL